MHALRIVGRVGLLTGAVPHELRLEVAPLGIPHNHAAPAHLNGVQASVVSGAVQRVATAVFHLCRFGEGNHVGGVGHRAVDFGSARG